MSALILSNNAQKYVSWKGKSTNSVVPVLSKPDLSADGPAFKARPINHYRKRLTPNAGSGNARSAGMTMDVPGGSVHRRTSDCLDDDVTSFVVKENITNNFDRNKCKPTRGANTNIKKTYYTDSRSYMKARCRTYEQNSKIGDKKSGETNAFETTNCYDLSGCNNKSVIYKPSNSGFATQGAVSSSSRLLKLKVETVTQNANSFSAYGHAAQNAGRYNGNSTAPYFLKSKENKCVPFRRNGSMTLCF